MAEVDTSFYKDAVAQNPLEVAGQVVDYRNKLLNNQQQQQQVQANNIKLATERFGLINNAASGLLQDPDLGKKDIKSKLWDTLARATAGDAMTAQHAVQFAQQFPTDPIQQRQAIEGVYAQTLDALNKGNAYLGANTAHDTGGGLAMSRQGAFSNQPPVNTGYLSKTVSPGTTNVNSDQKSPYFGREEATGGQGPSGWMPPANGAPARPVVPSTNKLIGDNEAINSGLYPNPAVAAKPASAPVAAPPTAIKPVITKLAPGELAGPEASRVAYAKDLADNKTYLERTNPLRMAIPLLEKLGTTGTGPGKETVNHIKAFAQSFGMPIPNADDLTSFAKAKKYLEQNATSIAPPGTNIPSVLAAFESNPNIQQPNAAASELAKNMLALSRMNRAALLAFKESGKPSSEYADWAANWSRAQDVRGYMADLLSPEDRAKMAKSIKPGTALAEKISNSVETARKLDLFGDVEGHDVKAKPKKAAQ